MSAAPPVNQPSAPSAFMPGEEICRELTFLPASDAGGTDFDVLMGYQMFLGRDPETSFVIADAKSSPVGAFLKALMASGEFQSAVLDRLAGGRALPHEAASPGPSLGQQDWLFRHVRIPPRDFLALRAQPGWRGWLGHLVHVPGFPSAPARSDEKPAADTTAAQAVADGFVLVTIDQPRPGEVFNPGAVINGSGWAIAPADVIEVAVLLDETVLAQARYGLPRPDIARRFPHYRHVEHCGFAFTVELPGEAVLTPESQLIVAVRTARGDAGRRGVRLRQPAEPEAAVGKAGRVKLAKDPSAAREMRMSIDEPVLAGEGAAAPVNGALRISGWAVAPTGVASVSVACDGVALGQAHTGMRHEDVGIAFPDHPGSLLAGFAMIVPQGQVTDGLHRIDVKVAANGGQILEKSFSVAVARDTALPEGAQLRLRVSPAEAGFGTRLLERQGHRPHFEVIVAGGKADDVRATLASVAAQIYDHWSVTIVAPDAASVARLKAYAGFIDAERVRVLAAGAKARAVLAEGFVIVLRAGDRLGCDALQELAIATALDRDTNFLYSDDLRRDAALGPAQADMRQPYLKPDWSPDLQLATNYIGRAWCASAALIKTAGLDAGSLASLGDYDLALRLTGHASAVTHVPHVLRANGPVSDTVTQERAALKAYVKTYDIHDDVEQGTVSGTWRIRRAASGSVSIIMPTCSANALVRTAIATIRAHAGNHDLEIVVVDNTKPSEKADRAWIRANADKVVPMPGTFNWSRFSNAGAAAARGEYLLFLNDDIEARQPGWLDAMLEHAQRPEVGVVGARLLYPDGKLQHGGMYLRGNHARHAFRFADNTDSGPFGLATVAREMIAVTGACQMMRREVFDTLGGFDEAHGVVNNDIDFCLRAWAAGLSVIYTPHATLIHHELASRADLQDSYDEARFDLAWRTRFLAGDPFRHPGLIPDADDYGIEPEPARLLHAGRRGPDPHAVSRILVLKLDHIGDFLTALPALHALRERFSNAAIDLLVPPASADLARQHKVIDKVYVFDFFHVRSGDGRKEMTSAALSDLRARLTPNAYDIAIDLRMHAETRHTLLHTGAAFLAGYDHGEQFPWLDVALEWEGDTRLMRKRAHISERLVQLVAATEAACRPDAFSQPKSGKLPASPAWSALPAAFRAAPVVCMHPGVGNVMRRWPASHYAALIDLLAEQAGLHVLLIGALEEAPVADDILRRLADPAAVESLVGKIKLAALSDVMSRCALFVGNNSGPHHLAASLGLPTLGIHSGVVDAAEWAPLGQSAMAIQRKMSCGPCYIEFPTDCPREIACLTGLLPRDVFAACRRLLAVR